MARCEQGLQQQPIDGLVRVGDRCQVDLVIPSIQQRIEGVELLNQLFCEEQSGA